MHTWVMVGSCLFCLLCVRVCDAFDSDVSVALDTVLQRALGLSPEPIAAVPLARAYAALRPEARARLLHVSCCLSSQTALPSVSCLGWLT